MAEKTNKPSMRGVFVNGLLNENPTFRLVLGTCPTLAVTTSAINGIGMGLAATFVLICSNVVISLVRKLIPDKARIPSFIVIIATFVTIVQLMMLDHADRHCARADRQRFGVWHQPAGRFL